ncbi:MFS general substrate transporter [Macrolepiota fuliginosa MF-IS2]|uniref:MFS general substrate transporter n=1 Tax=Macrolepiota fuliginosa MF-IS2 TaxID=1400762 RepID=A0A9P5WYK7_9AGAR|nr:MFS general substrate transporter [Macrolepiota fuliginosa MF-IS2]
MAEPTKDTSSLNHAPDQRIITAAEKWAVHKLDYSIIPVMMMFYLLSFLKGLGFTDHQYQVCITVLYVPYIAAELPSNLLLRWVGPCLLMPTILTAWGIVVTLQGLVSFYAGLVAIQAILGLIEGPMFPGIVLYLSGFYMHRDLSLCSGAFSGLLAAAIQNMDSIGLFSVLIGLISFFLVPSTPANCRFLTPSEKLLIKTHLEYDRPLVTPDIPSDKFSFHKILCSLTSIHVLILFIAFFLGSTTLYGMALFLPSIINQLGFSLIQSQLLSVGPFAATFFVTLLSAYLSDKYQNCVIPSAIISTLTVVGFALYLHFTSKFTAYGSLFLTVPSMYAGTPIIGGILSTWRFPTKEGLRFTKMMIMDLTFSVLTIVLVFVNVAVLHYKNWQKRQLHNKLLTPCVNNDEKESDGSLKAWMELGDRHSNFMYSY